MEAYQEEKSKFIVNGQEIYYVEAGQKGRQIALLIHGWSSSSYALSPLLGLLAQRFHCIAIDLPGYGDSPPLQGKTTIPRYAELIADLLAQVSSRPVVLVGHSMGGMISLTLALQHPVLIERMVLLNPTISGRLSIMINLAISPITTLERFGLGRFVVSSFERIFVGLTDMLMRPVSFAERTDITKDAYNRLRQDARKPGQGRVRAECYQAMLENDLSKRIKDVQAPALVIWGAEDNTVPLRDAGVVADEWPQADLRIFPKAGHWPQFETPDTTRRQVAAYLGLPLASSELYTPVGDDELARISEIARFLAHSDVGDNLNEAQRIRLAAQCKVRTFKHDEIIAHAKEKSQELFIIQEGYVEVWKDPDDVDSHTHGVEMNHVANLREGQITGELAMLDEGERSADLVAGRGGVTLLVLDRERLLTLCEDDAVLGARLLWNMSRVMSRRVRFVLWQLNQAQDKQLLGTAESVMA
ncbi:MAG: alpha/beta fold hydrolase [Chloroflexi bacterium]|nr:alpha/beta fold hydrolase [Chloroflexota bacterium]